MKKRKPNITACALAALASATLTTISHAAPVGQIIEDVARMGGGGSAYQSRHDADNSGIWLLLACAFIVFSVLVSIFKKNR